MEKWDTILDEIETEYEAISWSRPAAMFVLACLTETKGLPIVALDAIEVAGRYWNGDASEGELAKMRTICWSGIDSGRFGSGADHDYVAVRAAICALYPSEQNHDLRESLDWFLRLLKQLRPDMEGIDVVLRECFPNRPPKTTA